MSWLTPSVVAAPGAALTLAALDARSAAVRDSVLAEIAANPRLGAAYTAALERRNTYSDTSGAPRSLTARTAAHDALRETIMTHRASFPPQRFSIHTDLGNGASLASDIPPAVSTERAPATTASTAWRVAEARIIAATAAMSDPAAAGPNPARQRAESAYTHID